MIHVLLAEDEIALAKIIKDSLESRRKFKLQLRQTAMKQCLYITAQNRISWYWM